MTISKTSTVSFDKKVAMLAEFSVKYKNDKRFFQLFRDNDLGFPYAFGVRFGHIDTPSDVVKLYIEDTWNMLIVALLPEPEFGFRESPLVSTLDELLELAGLD